MWFDQHGGHNCHRGPSLCLCATGLYSMLHCRVSWYIVSHVYCKLMIDQCFVRGRHISFILWARLLYFSRSSPINVHSPMFHSCHTKSQRPVYGFPPRWFVSCERSFQWSRGPFPWELWGHVGMRGACGPFLDPLLDLSWRQGCKWRCWAKVLWAVRWIEMMIKTILS